MNTNHTFDLVRSLTQVLTDGTHTYLYGNMRIAQQSVGGTEYFLTDALGSVRQLVDATGELTLSQAYQPYGKPLTSDGSGTSPYGYAGEWTDGSGLQYLRARYYAPGQGRFVTKDPSRMEANLYLYALANPINRVDPIGLFSRDQIAQTFGEASFDAVLSKQSSNGEHWGLVAALLNALPGDTISAGKVAVGLTFPVPQVAYEKYTVGYDYARGITFNGFSWLSDRDTLPVMLPV